MTDNKYEYLGSRQHGTIFGRASQTAWETAAPHRAHVLRLLPVSSNERRGILGIFGVGDGTSLDLNKLLDRFHEVHLIDRDSQAIQKAIMDQRVANRHRLIQRVMDISGVHDLLESWPANESNDQAFQNICTAIDGHTFPELEQFDVVLSMSQIPQLALHAARCIKDDSIKLATAVTKIRDRHFDLMLDHVTSPGTAILVVDIVSSATVPPLASSPSDLPALIQLAISQGNFFPGALPAAMDRTIRERNSRYNQFDSSRMWIRQTPDEHMASVAWRVVIE